MQLLSFLALWFAKAFASIRPRPARRVPQTHVPTEAELEAEAIAAWEAEVERLFTAFEDLLTQWRNGTLPEQIKRARKPRTHLASLVARMPIRHPRPAPEIHRHAAPPRPSLPARKTPRLRRTNG